MKRLCSLSDLAPLHSAEELKKPKSHLGGRSESDLCEGFVSRTGFKVDVQKRQALRRGSQLDGYRFNEPKASFEIGFRL